MELQAGRSSLCFLISYFSVVHSNRDEIDKHLEMGKQFLAQGQFADALTHYHAAVEADPTNYQTLYRRATVYLAMGKSKSALPDLDLVVELKPDFISARVQRGNVLFKQGVLDAAESDYAAVLGADPNNADARTKLEALAETRNAISHADALLEQGDHDTAVFYLGKALDHCQWDSSLYEKRAAAYESHGEPQKAVADLRAITKLVADSTEHYYKISVLLYAIGDLDESLSQVRECLKLNPDHKLCFPHYKKVKKIHKLREQLNELVEKHKWMECLEKAQSVLKAESTVENLQLDVMKITCKCNLHAGHLDEAIQQCTEVLQKQNENDVDVLIDRAEAFIANEQFDEAIEDFQKAVNVNQEQRAKEGLDRANKLKKQSSKRDYYKILGVRRNADKRDIMKAYRKLAQKWHPDNFSDDVEKKKAEAKFIDIASAKEVLTNPEKRQKFDQGEDPLDPEQQQHGFHHGGFPHGFNPFGDGGGGGYTFKFNF